DKDLPAPVGLDFDEVPLPSPAEIHAGTYNQVVQDFLRPRAERPEAPPSTEDWARLEAVHRINETAKARCVGLVLETRPDHVDVEEVMRLRRLGATKLQVGLQAMDDEILALNKRGHTVAEVRRALALLRASGFKLQGHWMANLYGSNPERDVEDYRRLWSDAGVRPDELKLYPCSLIETAELMTHYQKGEWRPYDDAELLKVVGDGLAHTPPYCRLNRVIRDIPSHDIVVGNQQSNFRETAEAAVRRQGRRLNDIRAREVRTAAVDLAQLRLQVIAYRSAVGDERFYEFVDDRDRLAGFLRMTLPAQPAPFAELEGAALLRELHVYGTVAALEGAANSAQAQHRGLGRRLMDIAKAAAQDAGFAKLSVISAVGTRDYYRRADFVDGALYQHWACSRVSDGAAPPV
ncbi:MAG: radical SAM protein, partial [Myxococcota bacterium]